MFLLVGGDSEIGAAARTHLQARGHPAAATTRRPGHAGADRPFLELTRPLEDWEPPAGTRSACIFAAVARLAACAADPAGTAQVNVTQTLALIDRLLGRGIHVLFLSTNQVFDGEVATVPPDAPHCPVSEYGRQKAHVESALLDRLSSGAPIAILRLAKVVSAPMPLIQSWVDALLAGQPIRVFTDMTLAPTPTDLVCAAVAALMNDQATGIFQLTGPRDVTYAEVGRHVAHHVGAKAALVIEGRAAEAGLPKAAAPRHTTLDSTLLRERYGLAVPDADEVIKATIAAACARSAIAAREG